MSDIATGAARYGDTDNTLLLKIATKFWGDLADPGDIRQPQYGDTDNTLLLIIAQSLELL